MIKVTQYPMKYLTKFHFKLTVKCLEAYFEFYCLLAKPKKKRKKKKLFGENIQSSQHKKNSWNHILKTRWLQIKCIPLSADCVEKCGENLAKDLKSQVLTEITWCVRLLYCWVDVQMFLTLISLWNLPHEIQNKHFLTWKKTCNGEKKSNK